MPYLFYSSSTFKKSFVFKRKKKVRGYSFLEKSILLLSFLNLLLFLSILSFNFALFKINFYLSKVNEKNFDLNVKCQEVQKEISKIFRIENLEEKIKEFSLKKPEKNFSLTLPSISQISFTP